MSALVEEVEWTLSLVIRIPAYGTKGTEWTMASYKFTDNRVTT